jgi:hypothetical protein
VCVAVPRSGQSRILADTGGFPGNLHFPSAEIDTAYRLEHDRALERILASVVIDARTAERYG